MDKTKCQQVYWNLLQSMGDVYMAEYYPTEHILDWDETAACDALGTNFGGTRRVIEDQMGPEAMTRIRNFREESSDTFKARYILGCHREFHRAQLVAALKPTWRLYYYTIHQLKKRVD